MDNFLGTEYPEGKSREEFLEANCDAIENIGYTRRFTSDELLKKKDTLSELAIEINDIEEEKKDAMSLFKERLKPLNEEKTKLLSDLKNKSEYVNAPCYKIIDDENREVGFYNNLGELVYSRPIQPQEMQKTIMSISRKTGTND